mmetsp:Transcript_3504/g.5920  ORF Transcript_3504/g.5920 Transcript_3504/m.5920 type:complete len:358 (+) Transcript_3504:144-1217(+)
MKQSIPIAHLLLALYMLCITYHKVTAFGVHQPIRSKSHRGSKSSTTTTTTIRMYIDVPEIETPFDLFSTPTSSPVISPILSATQKIASDLQLRAQFEAEVLSDVSHVALDFTTLLSPNTAVIRLFTLVGRMLVISSDYIQDQYISPDDWAFNLFMLALSARSFLKSVRPMIAVAASNSTLTVRDRKAYSLLFDIIGMSVLQFKTLLTSKTLEWVQLGPNEEMELDGEFIYWLYSGETSSSNGDCNSTSNSISSRIFGEVQFAKKLQEPLHTAFKKKSKVKKVESTEVAPESKQRKIYVGQDGAVLLRISTSKLLELMNDDDELTTSVQRLVLLCMQEKLTRSCEEEDMRNSSIPVAI